MLSKTFLVDVSLDPFTCVNRLSVAKSARPILILLALLLSAPLPWGQVHTVVLGAFLLWNHCSCWGPRKSSYIAVLCRALSDQLAASDQWRLRACPPHPIIYTIAWPPAQQILLILPLQHPQRWRQQICKKQSTIDQGEPCTVWSYSLQVQNLGPENPKNILNSFLFYDFCNIPKV